MSIKTSIRLQCKNIIALQIQMCLLHDTPFILDLVLRKAIKGDFVTLTEEKTLKNSIYKTECMYKFQKSVILIIGNEGEIGDDNRIQEKSHPGENQFTGAERWK